MEKKVIKLGVVGLKRGAYVAWTLIGDDNVVIRAIADSDPKTLQACKADYEKNGVKDLLCFNSIEELLKSDIDAVYIATDKPLHTKHTVMALEAGKHVLSEIPVIETMEEVKILRDAVKSHPNLKYMAGENCFYWAFIEAWKRMREEGKFGDILYAESEYLHAPNPDDIKPYEPENHWRRYNPAITYLTHNLGPLLYIMDDYCVSVSCMAPSVTKYNQYAEGDENGIAIFKTAKGAVIRIFIGFGMYVGYDHNFALYGTKGSILTDKTKPLEEATSFAKMKEIPDTFEKFFEIPVRLSNTDDVYGHGGVDAKMIRDFIKCIIEDTDPPIDVDMGIRISLPGIIANESAKRGGELLEIPKLFD
ncbi:MAG: Gfo/Idh/MocA family oxidoreductase [Ruminococcaceae bacterium]|nr:Gfo/Idh/MocA family oxidoreductase [Oscillospiraceae bacterium]